MIRRVIEIDEELCNGCGLCIDACHEAAIGLVHGKAKLLRDDYCDGLGNCLPACPTNAITFVEREAADFDEEAVRQNLERMKLEEQTKEAQKASLYSGGCPGSRMMAIERNDKKELKESPTKEATISSKLEAPVSALRQWPVQIQLVPPNAPYFSGADLLIAADCTAFSYGDFHRFMKDKITLIACPKLDEVDYSEKLSQIMSHNNLNSITVIRMEVPCCAGIVHAVQSAMAKSGKIIPWRVIVISTDGIVLEDRG